jgi:hypothetical protein
MTWKGKERKGKAMQGMAWHDMERKGMAWHRMVRQGNPTQGNS